jgi:hypothetical protein
MWQIYRAVLRIFPIVTILTAVLGAIQLATPAIRREMGVAPSALLLVVGAAGFGLWWRYLRSRPN